MASRAHGAEEEEINSSATPETELDDNVLCSPCVYDGKRLVAVGYCVNCKEYLCKTCYKYHRYPSLTRKHVMLGQEQMGIVEGGDNNCPEHEKREIEYHCPTHAFFGCHVCCFQHQKSCKDSIYIPDVSVGLVQDKLKELNGQFDSLAQKANDVLSEVQHIQSSIKQRSTEMVSAIKAFKLHVIETVEKLEKELIKKTEDIGEKETNNSEAVAEKCKAVQDTVEAISTEIEVLRNRGGNTGLYIAIARAQTKLEALEDDLCEVDCDRNAKIFTFEANADLTKVLKSPLGLGKLVDSSAISSIDHVSNINAKTSEDSNDCCVIGAVLMPGDKLVIGDQNNKNVKMIDIRQYKILSELKLSNTPSCIAKESDQTVAATVPNDKKIVFVRTNPTLSVDRELGLKEACCVVACCNGKLIVGFNYQNKVKVMDLQGTVFHEIQNDYDGKALFGFPRCIAVNLENTLMYVSNLFEQKIVCTKLDGTLVAAYTNDDLKYPLQTIVDRTDMVFVVGKTSKNVHQITPDCKKGKVILSSSEGLVEPTAISYDEDKRRLYVGDKNYVKVYKVTYGDM